MIDPAEDWHCDKCGVAYKDGDIIYTIATNREAKTFRHSRCQPTREELVADLRSKLGGLRTKLRRIR